MNVRPTATSDSLDMTRRSYAVKALIGQAAFAGLAFVGSVLAARLLGPAAKGELTAWTLTVAVGGLVLAGSIPTGLARAFLHGDRTRLRGTMNRHFLATVAICIPLAALGLAFGLDRDALLLFLVIGVPCTVITQDALMVLQAAKRPWLYHAVRIVAAISFGGGLAVLLAFGPDHPKTLVFVLFAAGTVASAGAALVVAMRHFGSRRPHALGEMADLGRGSFSATLFDLALLRCDQFVLVGISGPAALGIYSVAVNCAEVGQWAGNSFGQALFEDETTLSRDDARRLFLKIAGLVAAICAVVAALGFVLISPVFGEAFASARWALLLLAPGIVARAIGHAGYIILLAAGRGPIAARIGFVSFAFALPLWVVGAAVGGATGTALASTLAYMIQMVLTFSRFRTEAP